MADMADIATYLARRGWAVYPQTPLGNVPIGNCQPCRARDCPGAHHGCECLTGVRPCHALHAATTNVELTRSRWEHAPRCNPALNLGTSGLVVLDIDCHATDAPTELAPGLANPGVANGVGAYSALLEHVGADWPEDTLTVATPTGGLHVYYRAPEVPLRHCHAAWQVEVKAGACSITAPGSVRALEDGTHGLYERISDTTEVAPFPAWLGRWLVSLGRVADPSSKHTHEPPAMPSGNAEGHSRSWWQRAWNDQLGEIANAEAGTRNNVVLRRGLRLFNLAAEAGCPWTAADAEAALVKAQHQYAANTGRPSNPSEYRAVAEATRERATVRQGRAVAV